jgi:hypothetical protein
MAQNRPTREEAVKELVSRHFDADPDVTRIYWMVPDEEASPSEPIRLLEVDEASVTIGEVQPFTFGPTEDIPYPTSIAMISPEEHTMIKTKPESLPKGWELARARVFDRPA